MSDTGECGTCHAPVFWTLTPAGAKAPIDTLQADDGNTLVLAPRGYGEMLSVVLSKGALERARTQRMPLHKNHWATCPDREEWRQRQQRKAAR